MPTPFQNYYNQCSGKWKGPLWVSIIDSAQLANALSPSNRRSLRMMAFLSRRFSAVTLHTSVCFDEQQVRHTTRITAFGFTVVLGEEILIPDSGGRQFSLRGWSKPRFAPKQCQEVTGVGCIDEDGIRASYELAWMGTQIRQSTSFENDRVILVQEGPGFQSRVELSLKRPRQ